MGHPNNKGKYAKYDMPIPGPGCPPAYTDPNVMWDKIAAYIESCWEEDWREEYDKDTKEKKWVLKTDHEGNPLMRLRERPTITGLALALGFTTRLSLINYQGKPEFKEVVEKGKLIVESYYEQGGAKNEIAAPTAIFALKNFGWTDTIQIKDDSGNKQLTADDIKVYLSKQRNE